MGESRTHPTRRRCPLGTTSPLWRQGGPVWESKAGRGASTGRSPWSPPLPDRDGLACSCKTRRRFSRASISDQFHVQVATAFFLSKSTSRRPGGTTTSLSPWFIGSQPAARAHPDKQTEAHARQDDVVENSRHELLGHLFPDLSPDPIFTVSSKDFPFLAPSGPRTPGAVASRLHLLLPCDQSLKRRLPRCHNLALGPRGRGCTAAVASAADERLDRTVSG